jgi:hypothetical protein
MNILKQIRFLAFAITVMLLGGIGPAHGHVATCGDYGYCPPSRELSKGCHECPITQTTGARGSTSVPEPSTLLLLGTALAGLVWLRRK